MALTFHAVRVVTATAVQELLRSWRAMLLTSFLFQIAELALLTPLVTFGIRALVSLSGGPVISDREILAFALRPVGVFTLVVGISARVAVLALGQACLLGIALGAARGTPVAALSALGWSGARVVKILAVTTRLAIRILAVCAPFLAVAGLVYFFLLTEFDINYYLKDWPSELWIAAAVIGALFVVMFALLAWKASSWVYTLPLLLFENVEPSRALGISEERSRGHRGVVALVFLGWILGVAALSILGVSATGELATALLPRVQGSLSLLVPSLGAILVLWVIESALLTAFVSIVFAALVIAFYEKSGSGSRSGILLVDDVGPRASRLRGKRVLMGTIAAAVLSAIVGWLSLAGARDARPVAVIGHRGAAALAPENTLSAVERAIAAGADWIEIDVQETADGEVVVLHDSDFKKLAGSPLKIWEGSFAEIRKLDVGRWFGPEFRGEKVPTLEEVLLRARGRAKVLIELKSYGRGERLEERVAEIVERSGMEREIAVMSLERRAVEKMKALRPDFPRGLVAATAVGRLASVDVDFLAVSVPLATPSLIRQAHARNREVYVWTVNDELAMAHQILRGVDGLITDYPARAEAAIRAESELDPIERLLVGTAFLLGARPTRFRLTRDSD